MKTTQTKTIKIRLNSDRANKVNGFYNLMLAGPVVCLPEDEYVIPEESLDVLKQKKIEFEVLN